MGEYSLKCPKCGSVFEDKYTNSCPDGCSSLIKAEYKQKKLRIRDLPGMFRYHDWLPVEDCRNVGTKPVTYKSRELSRELGIKNLYICFNGYNPDINAAVKSCSFKELEAVPTMLRMKEKGSGIIQVSSAGNTARAFCEVSAATGMPVIAVVPKYAKDNIWTTVPAGDVLMITVDGDYTDAIEFGNRLCSINGVVAEGGAKNPARRDGMGTTLLDCAVAAGRIPDWYFQAVGSGTGAIAAFEMSERLIEDGRYGGKLPRLYLSQNDVFAPIVNAWKERRREIIPDKDMPDAKNSAMKAYSPVLTNRTPPYSVFGGLFDALTATDGITVPVPRDKAESAGKLFEEVEGPDLDPAAAVCLASLLDVSEKGTFKPEDTVMLNITGGGYRRAREDFDIIKVNPSFEASAGDDISKISSDVAKWVKRYV
ncbi:cysteate synthase [Methanomicrobium sp. W14]|uniref:cysteate synthase n=1 Tax=Methanomicrobium sp. W14 TaxID=2817839 RepID=UPI001AE4A421|nr:cysteate synthase [Methanomicrobium sp. W14]MBP2133545.1 cysteate synthase [Methanomicrobium sp. W14]